MSVNFRTPTLEAASRNLGKITSELERMQQSDASRLRDEYERLVQGLAAAGTLPANEELGANPVLPEEILSQAA